MAFFLYFGRFLGPYPGHVKVPRTGIEKGYILVGLPIFYRNLTIAFIIIIIIGHAETCGNSQARDRTCIMVADGATAVKMLDH